eukprot:8175961-Heterocapsa_arctica.AAC.1
MPRDRCGISSSRSASSSSSMVGKIAKKSAGPWDPWPMPDKARTTLTDARISRSKAGLKTCIFFILPSP